MDLSLDSSVKKRRAIGETIKGDQAGHVRRARTRTAFWRLLRRECKEFVDDLLAFVPAQQALEAWPEHAATNPVACDTLRGLQELGYLQYVGGAPDDDMIDHASERLGSFWHWPFEHVRQWCIKHDLDSPAIRQDALYTVTQHLRIPDDVVGTAARPVLAPFAIPAQVSVCWLHADDAEDWIEGRGDYLCKWAFTEPELERLLEHLKVHLGNVPYPDLPFEEAQDHIRRAAIHIAEREIELALSWREREVAGRRSKKNESIVPADEHIVWFIRVRVKGELVEDVAVAAGKSRKAIEGAMSDVTRLLELPRKRRRRETKQRIRP